MGSEMCIRDSPQGAHNLRRDRRQTSMEPFDTGSGEGQGSAEERLVKQGSHRRLLRVGESGVQGEDMLPQVARSPQGIASRDS